MLVPELCPQDCASSDTEPGEKFMPGLISHNGGKIEGADVPKSGPADGAYEHEGVIARQYRGSCAALDQLKTNGCCPSPEGTMAAGAQAAPGEQG